MSFQWTWRRMFREIRWMNYAVSFIFMAVSIVVGIYFQAKTKSVEALAILLGRSAAFPILIVYVLLFCKMIVGHMILIIFGIRKNLCIFMDSFFNLYFLYL